MKKQGQMEERVKETNERRVTEAIEQQQQRRQPPPPLPPTRSLSPSLPAPPLPPPQPQAHQTPPCCSAHSGVVILTAAERRVVIDGLTGQDKDSQSGPKRRKDNANAPDNEIMQGECEGVGIATGGGARVMGSREDYGQRRRCRPSRSAKGRRKRGPSPCFRAGSLEI